MKKTLCRALSVVALMAMLAGCAPKETGRAHPCASHDSRPLG